MRIGKHIANAVRCALAVTLLFPALAFGAVHDLVIYHTNDVHGYAFEELGEGKLTKIGYDRLKALIDADPSPRKLLLDAGDVLHGQSFAVAKRGELAVAHLSSEAYCRPSSLTLAREVPGIDMVIDGHSHSTMPAQAAESGGAALVASTASVSA